MVSEDEKMLKERMRHILHMMRWPLTKFAANETQRARLGRQINGDAAVPYSTIVMFLNSFHNISADWLIMGEGGMYKADHTAPRIYNTKNEVNNSTAGGSINVGTTTIPVSVQALLDEKDKRIKELEQDKQLLQGLLSAFTKTTK
jgi:hypothetical protein